MATDYKAIVNLKRKGVTNRTIADMLGISRNTVNKVISRIEGLGLALDDTDNLSNEDISMLFARPEPVKRDESIVMPDYEALAKELVKPGVTMQLLWEEYRTACRLSGKQGYRLTQFKKYFRDHLAKIEFKDIIHHKAGEQIEVDWAGVRPHWQDPITGETVYGYLFAAVLPFSGMGFAYITPDMKMPSWIECHVKMYEYFGGSTKILTPDNLKTGITKHTKDEILVNETYEDMARYYNTVVVPARVRMPRDKSQAENLVLRFEQNIVGRLRNYQFFSITEYNEAAIKEVDAFNRRPFQKKAGSRYELFMDFEKDALIPLPPAPYVLATFKKAKVQSNSHIAYKKNYYSVPYKYIGEEVDLRIASGKIRISFSGIELCEHSEIFNRMGAYSTDPSHMPPKSNAYGEWNSERYLRWAKRIGPQTYEVVRRLFDGERAEQIYYRAVHSILNLATKYSDQRLEVACASALEIKARPRYQDIKNILSMSEDWCQEDAHEDAPSTFVRGGDYFGEEE